MYFSFDDLSAYYPLKTASTNIYSTATTSAPLYYSSAASAFTSTGLTTGAGGGFTITSGLVAATTKTTTPPPQIQVAWIIENNNADCTQTTCKDGFNAYIDLLAEYSSTVNTNGNINSIRAGWAGYYPTATPFRAVKGTFASPTIGTNAWQTASGSVGQIDITPGNAFAVTTFDSTENWTKLPTIPGTTPLTDNLCTETWTYTYISSGTTYTGLACV